MRTMEKRKIHETKVLLSDLAHHRGFEVAPGERSERRIKPLRASPADSESVPFFKKCPDILDRLISDRGKPCYLHWFKFQLMSSR